MMIIILVVTRILDLTALGPRSSFTGLRERYYYSNNNYIGIISIILSIIISIIIIITITIIIVIIKQFTYSRIFKWAPQGTRGWLPGLRQSYKYSNSNNNIIISIRISITITTIIISIITITNIVIILPAVAAWIFNQTLQCFTAAFRDFRQGK